MWKLNVKWPIDCDLFNVEYIVCQSIKMNDLLPLWKQCIYIILYWKGSGDFDSALWFNCLFLYIIKIYIIIRSNSRYFRSIHISMWFVFICGVRNIHQFQRRPNSSMENYIFDLMYYGSIPIMGPSQVIASIWRSKKKRWRMQRS